MIDAEAIGDRRIYLERLAGDTGAFVRGHGIHRFHVVQPIGELHQDDSDIADHRQHHLAKTLRLRLRPAREMHLIEFAHAIHERRDLLTKLLVKFSDRRLRVFYDVMQYRGRNRLRVQMHVGENLRDCERMGDEGIAGHARLTAVGGRAKLVRTHHLLDLLGRHVGFQGFDKAL